MKPTPSPRLCPPLRYVRRERGARRRGQALLLAVLLMVFAALLGVTMITLVASNLNQTTRQGGLSAARAASTSAITFVNDRLTNSIEGDMWRPWQDNKPPKPGDADFNTYFTALERAKGWVNKVDFTVAPTGDNNGNGVTYETASAAATLDPREQKSEEIAFYDKQIQAGTPCFVKFPDPRGPATNASGPQYLVQLSPTDQVPAGQPRAGTPTGSLRLTVIGTSEDEPGAFDLREVNKPTTVNRGPFSYARFDSNYDYKDKRVARTKLRFDAVSTVAPTTLRVGSTVGLDKGRTIIIGDDPSTPQSAIVMGVDNTNPADPTVTVNAAVTVPANTPITAASPLMDGIGDADFDAEGDGSTGNLNAWETTREPVRNADASLASGARRLFFNGGMALDGKTTVSLGSNDSLSVAGLISPIPGASVGKAMLAAPGAPPTEILPASNQPASTSTASLQRLVRDNRGAESTYIQPLTPPSIDGENSRYRELTEFADPSAGSAQGYGPGVYIGNRGDVEKTTVGGTTMSIYDTQRLYANKYLAFGTPATINTLEDRHIRGWISPWEFLPRGVLIELQGDKIIFTLDDLSDAVPNLPNLAKAWKRDDGSPLVTPGANTFRMVLDISNTSTNGTRTFSAPGDTDTSRVFTVPGKPFNGLIFTEGNARVRGFLSNSSTATAATTNKKSLTIVSMGSIFIEGSVIRDANKPDTPSTDAPRLALLAKRNVVLNPTQFVSQVAGTQDRNVAGLTLAAAPVAGTAAIDVNNPEAARVGDVIRVTNDPLWHTVMSISGNRLNLSTALGTGTTGAVGDPVRRLSNPKLVPIPDPRAVAPATTQTVYDASPANGDVLARDVRADGVAAALPTSLAWMHAGQVKPGIDFQRDVASGGSGTFHVKENTTVAPTPTPQVIEGKDTPGVNEKKFFASSSGGPQPADANVDLLDIDGDGTRGTDADETLQKLLDQFKPPPPSPPNPGPNWNVIITAKDAANVLAPGIPARLLAAVGSNAAPLPGDDASLAPDAKYAIPLTLNGGWFVQPSWNAATTSLLPAPGLVPWQHIGTSTAQDGEDDLETTRDDFYQTNGNATPTQAPTRWRNAPVPAAPAPTMSPVGSNIVAFSHDLAVVPGTPVTALPDYYFGPIKLERDDFSFPKPTANPGFNAVPFFVQATMFAQEGSWFVVTPPLNTVPDINNNGGAADAPDLAAATRYHRQNYRVVVKGTIVQNFAPTARTDENGVDKEGAMFRWINALSHPTDVASDDGTATGNGRGRDWQAIEYQADPLPFYNGLYLPPTPDLIYTS